MHRHTERTLIGPSREPYGAERRKVAHVRDYVEHHEAVRKRITPAWELKPLPTDISDRTAGL
ncbi:hypothetical protein OG462_42045 [Streptomyces sp. NBC_01077]|uniref:hypothetical protein n=1 Tax=Streptomyces sp. NBC_01077 TaxID=2903746 RepID=UPI00386C5E6A|nr:hypothetical protein OG462_02975 [Streptomyces sp. NBC_01077]WSV43451.1 hypothetical protein OG462_42045 [Streptomyces sp. NBC_01077]